MPKDKKDKKVPNPPISFRMPLPLRDRLRRFAKARSLGESEALRLVVSEHLNELDERRDLEDAERWQLAEALKSLRDTRAGRNREVAWDDIERLFGNVVPTAPRPRD